jgi:hypothetical protein
MWTENADPEVLFPLEDGSMAQMGHGDAGHRHDFADRLEIKLHPWQFRLLDSLEKKSIVEQFVAFVKGPIWWFADRHG